MAVEAYRDDSGRLCLLLNAPEGEPPSQFTILKAGETDTSKGPVLFDDIAAELVLERFQKHGQSELPVDYDHGMLGMISTPESSKAAGWFTPAVVAGELMAMNVTWTPKAKQALKDREFRFFSPALWLAEAEGDETPRVTRLINVALTNLPATRNQMPLVASESTADRPPRADKGNNMNEIQKLLGVNSEAEAVVLIGKLQGNIALVLSASNTGTIEEAVEQLKSWKAAASEAVTLADKVRKLETEKAESTREQLILTLNEAGKLPESLYGWARTQSLESLQTFGDAAPVSPKHTNHEPGGETPIQLSDAEVEVCRQMGMTRAEYKEAKKTMATDHDAEIARREGRVL